MSINKLAERIISGYSLTVQDAVFIADATEADMPSLFESANKIRGHFRSNAIGLCAIVNAKSGACSEDCSYCAQSSRSRADINVYPFLDGETILAAAREAADSGIRRFSLVTSGRKVPREDLPSAARIIAEIRKIGLIPCASLGILNRGELTLLKDAGLDRYHHNLEASERFFPGICRTHTYEDRVRTIEAAQNAGLSVCSGGIFGMGETWEDRIGMAFALRGLAVDSVALNFLIPIKGTAMENRALLPPFEALRIISLYRFILPDKEIRVCGGRTQVLAEFHPLVFLAGADGMMSGNYLTTNGRDPAEDIALIKAMGLSI